MGLLAVRVLRAVLVVVLVGTVFLQAGMLWALVSGSDPEDGSLPLTPLRVTTILGMVAVVLRMLLAQAVARDAEAARMRAELDEVI